MTLRRLLPAAIAVAVVVPASASAATLKGTVVHHSKKSFVVAGASGTLYRVHADSSPRARRTVKVHAAKLVNGSYKATSVKTTGRASRTRIKGVVSYRKGRTFVVSAGGASLLVHGKGDRVGRKVVVRAKVAEDGSLTETSMSDEGHADTMEVEGTITAVDPILRTLTVTASDDDNPPVTPTSTTTSTTTTPTPATITIQVPDTFDITQFAVGQTVDLHVTQNTDGTFTLVDSSEDGNANEADNPGDCQGGDHHGDTGAQQGGQGTGDGGQGSGDGGSDS